MTDRFFYYRIFKILNNERPWLHHCYAKTPKQWKEDREILQLPWVYSGARIYAYANITLSVYLYNVSIEGRKRRNGHVAYDFSFGERQRAYCVAAPT